MCLHFLKIHNFKYQNWPNGKTCRLNFKVPFNSEFCPKTSAYTPVYTVGELRRSSMIAKSVIIEKSFVHSDKGQQIVNWTFQWNYQRANLVDTI